jgi:molybdate transport system substrate-binding protein
VSTTVTYGSSGSLFAQLLNRAPFDVFLSADVGYPNELAARGLTLADGTFTYGVGRIVLWAPAGSPIDVATGLTAVVDPRVRHLAIANPAHAPYGRAAEAALRAAGVYDRVAAKLVLGENVAQTLQFVQSGAADLGIIARALAVSPPVRGSGQSWDIPADWYPPIAQGGAILRWAESPEAARQLRAFMLGGEARAILERYGIYSAGS